VWALTNGVWRAWAVSVSTVLARELWDPGLQAALVLTAGANAKGKANTSMSGAWPWQPQARRARQETVASLATHVWSWLDTQCGLLENAPLPVI
jgi:hypothetical protein